MGQIMSRDEKTLVIELNEFNVDLLTRVSERYGYENIKSVLSWQHCDTVADHDKEHNGLDPWCQWVSVHTELPSSTHKVIRLGDVDKLQYPQIWERLGKKGLTTGVWGAMNARRNDAPLNNFFATDPWNFTENPYPEKYANFFALPVYFSKNYLDLSILKTIVAAMKTAGSIVKNISPITLLKDGWFTLRQLFKVRPNTCFLFSAFELISARLFLNLRKKYNPDVCFVFLNLVAHFQHHGWKSDAIFGKEAQVVFAFLDRILGLLLERAPENQRVLLLNAFTQRNVDQEQFYCYRQINPYKFLENIGLNPIRVEQCMTNDGHAFFETQEECRKAANILSEARVGKAAAFFIEIDEAAPTKLFYQFSFWGGADEKTILTIGGKDILLFTEFALHAKRTGAHVQAGDAFGKGIGLPEKSANYEIFNHIWPKNIEPNF
jgi:hypothetical protein